MNVLEKIRLDISTARTKLVFLDVEIVDELIVLVIEKLLSLEDYKHLDLFKNSNEYGEIFYEILFDIYKEVIFIFLSEKYSNSWFINFYSNENTKKITLEIIDESIKKIKELNVISNELLELFYITSTEKLKSLELFKDFVKLKIFFRSLINEEEPSSIKKYFLEIDYISESNLIEKIEKFVSEKFPKNDEIEITYKYKICKNLKEFN